MPKTRTRFYTQTNCIICNKKFDTSRRDAKYCSGSCRNKAFYERQKVAEKYKTNVLNMFELQDVRTISKYSETGAAVVVKIAALTNADLAREVLDGFWDVLVACGQLDPR